MPMTAVSDLDLVRPLRWGQTQEERRSLVWKEWLVTNGLGGYASGTVSGALTRRFHGLLIAALPNPRGREMMLNALYERITLPGGEAVLLGAEEGVDTG